MAERILRIDGVRAHTGLSRSTVYNFMEQGTFPRPVPLGTKHAVGWLESEVSAWIDRQVRRARSSVDTAEQSA